MNFIFENQGTTTYLVYAIGAEDSIDSMSLGMLTNNKIPGLAPAVFTQMDDAKYIKYNVSAKISVKQFFEGAVNKKRLLGVFNGIVDAMLSAEDYMIDTNTILLDLNYIFADVSTCETVLVCLPVLEQGQETDLSTFFKTIMFSTQFDQTENCDHVAGIINYLNSSPIFSLVDFKAVLDSFKGAIASAPSQPVVQQRVQPVVAQQPKLGEQPVQPTVQASSLANVQQPAQQIIQQKPAQPVQKPAQAAPVSYIQNTPQVQQTGKSEKQISMFSLLMHYNKENKELYNAQKAAKKAAKAQGAPAAVLQKQPKNQPQSAGFAVPGAPTNTGFAIPGQQKQPIQANPQPIVAQQLKVQQQPVVAQQTKIPQQPIQPVQPAYVPSAVPQGQAANFGETTVLGTGGIGETTVLGANTPEIQNKPHLIRAKNNERINLDKPVFRIGKEKSYVDYFVSDNTAISRSHANIIQHDDQYFIVDTNSTNHTYVNGGMIQSNVETALSHGTKIRLANEEFEFKLY